MKINIDEKTIEKLIDMALKKREEAYVPYSNFKVGSAVLTSDGEVIGGFNIENASFGATNCAERTAIFSALNRGYKEIKALAVVGDLKSYTYPCGICRQVMAEFSKETMPVIVIKSREDYKIHTLGEILPGAFTKKDLDEAKGEGAI